MSNYSKIYWITRLDSLSTLMVMLFITAIIGLIAYMIFYFSVLDDSVDNDMRGFNKKFGKYKNYAIWMMIISTLTMCFVPSKNEALLIMAGGKTLDYIQSDSSLSKIPYQTTQAISTILENELKKMKSKQ